MTGNNTNTELKRKVDLLKCLNVNVEVDDWGRLLLIQASGISENGHAGIPVLVPADTMAAGLTDGILELNFVIRVVEAVPSKRVEWDIAVVYQMDLLPSGIKAIKVNAAQNADIALLLN